ncbi:MAG: enoyl-CoA hydratase-related protein [Pseudomonadota bacterium]
MTKAPSFDTLTYAVAGGVATVTLNRPDAANALNVHLAKDFYDAILLAEEDEAVRSVMITGSGKMFCAGGDLSAIAGAEDSPSAEVKRITHYFHGAIARMARMDAPVIAAVNGTAAGAGFSLVCACDMAIASEKAKFTMAYTAAGLAPDGSSTFFLPRLIGLRRAQELMLTNRLVTAAEAAEFGIVNEVVPAEGLNEAAEGLAARLAGGPTKAFGAVKQMLAETFDNGLETQMELETRSIAGMCNTHDGVEGVSAFREKRQPAFKGR